MVQSILLVITAIMAIFYVVLIVYYLRSWLLIPIQINEGNYTPSTFISIIIPARNEEKNIENCLDSILRQSYPKELMEVFVVDDYSTDNTAQLVSNYKDARIKLISLDSFIKDEKIYAYKKKSIEIAIGLSSGELILTTDADCTASSDWLITLERFYKKNKPALIAMPVKIKNGKNFLSAFESLDFITMQGITGAAVSKQQLNLCNGANLAYTKKAFEAVNGFKGINEIASGDDMLLMEKISSQPGGVAYLKAESVIVETKAISSWKQFIQQRQRWASKSTAYKDIKLKSILAFIYIFNLCVLLTGFSFFIFNHPLNIDNCIISPFLIFIIILGLKIFVEFLFLFTIAKFYKQRSILWWFPLAAILHVLYIIMAGFLGMTKTYKWKGRIVK